MNNKLLPIPFTWTPNVMLGKQEYSCHQGKYFSENKKKNYIEQRNCPKKSDIFAKSRKHTKPTKKMDYPVKFCVKKIFRFTLYKIISDSKHNHSKKQVARKQYLEACKNKQKYHSIIAVLGHFSK